MPDDPSFPPAGQPGTTSPSSAPSQTDRETNREIGAGVTPGAVSRSGESGQPPSAGEVRPPNVGDAHAPTSADDVVEGADKTLYDRLADKDVTPPDESGDS